MEPSTLQSPVDTEGFEVMPDHSPQNKAGIPDRNNPLNQSTMNLHAIDPNTSFLCQTPSAPIAPLSDSWVTNASLLSLLIDQEKTANNYHLQSALVKQSFLKLAANLKDLDENNREFLERAEEVLNPNLLVHIREKQRATSELIKNVLQLIGNPNIKK
jgi:hypothetical protein